MTAAYPIEASPRLSVRYVAGSDLLSGYGLLHVGFMTSVYFRQATYGQQPADRMWLGLVVAVYYAVEPEL